jgi:hypothetical protein
MSSSGQYQTAVCNADNAGQIYYSIDYGNTWTISSTAPSEIWSSIAMSSSGQYLSACASGTSGQIYYSINTIQLGMGSVSLNSINITPSNTYPTWSITSKGDIYSTAGIHLSTTDPTTTNISSHIDIGNLDIKSINYSTRQQAILNHYRLEYINSVVTIDDEDVIVGDIISLGNLTHFTQNHGFEASNQDGSIYTVITNNGITASTDNPLMLNVSGNAYIKQASGSAIDILSSSNSSSIVPTTKWVQSAITAAIPAKNTYFYTNAESSAVLVNTVIQQFQWVLDFSTEMIITTTELINTNIRNLIKNNTITADKVTLTWGAPLLINTTNTTTNSDDFGIISPTPPNPADGYLTGRIGALTETLTETTVTIYWTGSADIIDRKVCANLTWYY